MNLNWIEGIKCSRCRNFACITPKCTENVFNVYARTLFACMLLQNRIEYRMWDNLTCLFGCCHAAVIHSKLSIYLFIRNVYVSEYIRTTIACQRNKREEKRKKTENCFSLTFSFSISCERFFNLICLYIPANVIHIIFHCSSFFVRNKTLTVTCAICFYSFSFWLSRSHTSASSTLRISFEWEIFISVIQNTCINNNTKIFYFLRRTFHFRHGTHFRELRKM